MGRLPSILTAAVMITAFSCGDDGPSGPSTGNDHQFYPLAVGNTWNYDRNGSISLNSVQIGTVSGEATVEISGTATHSEGFDVYVQDVQVSDTVTVYGQSTYSDSSYTEYLRLTGTGLHGYRHLTDTDSSFTVPFPIQDGNIWTFSQEPPTTGEVLSVSETVTVPAGTFTGCVEMQFIWIDSSMIVCNTVDLARNAGEVRNESVNTVGTFVTSITSSLVDCSLY